MITRVLLAMLVAILPAQAAELRIGLNEDPDILDPTLGRTFVGRIVFAAMCDKLFDISPDLQILPQLATGHSWSADGKSLTVTLRGGVKFQDGEPLDAAAVKYSLDRHIAFPGSTRRSELGSVASVTAVDPATVRIDLKSPFAPLLGVLADRAGMIVSPKAATAAGQNFGAHPVCAGPYRLVERVAQDRIVLERFEGYWDKGRAKFDRITYLPIPDSTVRLANLKSGDLDFIERVAPTDLAGLAADKRFKVTAITELGYQGITFNLANGPRAETPLGRDARVRHAFELSLDRDAINQVVFDGVFTPDNQWSPPDSPFHDPTQPIPKRDIATARALLKEAGVPHPAVTLMVQNSPVSMQLAQVVQAMAGEAGFEVKLQATEFATALQASDKGDFEAIVLAWSGRIDPDGNIFSFVSCGGALNEGHYCDAEVDAALAEGRGAATLAARQAAYAKVTELTLRDLPIVYLYHQKWIWAFSRAVTGFVPYPDGLIRVLDMSKG
jgi:peptide/nickel transport system substrate-binding protein